MVYLNTELIIMSKMHTVPPVLVSYAVTRKCNLRCLHCYSESVEEPHPNELSTEEALELISDISDLGARMIIFDGGEPTLRDDLPRLVKHAADSGLSPLLGSNGMVDTLTKNYALELKEAGLKVVSISLDGSKPDTHDEFRGFDGSWQRTIEGIKNCVEVGLPFQIGVAVHKYNYGELAETVELAKKLGANAVEVFDYVPIGRGSEHLEYELDIETRKNLIDEIIQMQRSEDEIYFRVIGVPEYWVQIEKMVSDEDILKFVRSCCGAGIRYATILYEGTVFPCMLLQIPLGNVRKQRFSEIWRNSPVLDTLRNTRLLKGKCGKCRYREICRGARCRAYAKTGELMAEDPSCWFELNDVT